MSAKFKVQSAKFKVQSSKCKVQSSKEGAIHELPVIGKNKKGTEKIRAI
jgi:hypothetical protein